MKKVNSQSSPRIFRIFVGTVSGGFLSAFSFGIVWWIVIYFTESGTGTWGNTAWASLAATVGGVAGFFSGLLLGLWLSLVDRGLIVGTLSGLVVGSLLLILLANGQGHPDVEFRTGLLLVSCIPAGALSGFLTSVVLFLLSHYEI